jgi:hypothetical protein
VNPGVQSSGYSALRQPVSPGMSGGDPVASLDGSGPPDVGPPVLVASLVGPAPLVGATSAVDDELSSGTAVPDDPAVRPGVPGANRRATDQRYEENGRARA